MIRLINDEAGFIVSAELILVATIAVLSMVVGLSELANNINQELEDVASAFGAVNQSYRYNGLTGHKGTVVGSRYRDFTDFCDDDCDIVSTRPRPEKPSNKEREES
jgi:hypothetical protein